MCFYRALAPVSCVQQDEIPNKKSLKAVVKCQGQESEYCSLNPMSNLMPQSQVALRQIAILPDLAIERVEPDFCLHGLTID
jgi:hypothetical protein